MLDMICFALLLPHCGDEKRAEQKVKLSIYWSSLCSYYIYFHSLIPIVMKQRPNWGCKRLKRAFPGKWLGSTIGLGCEVQSSVSPAAAAAAALCREEQV